MFGEVRLGEVGQGMDHIYIQCNASFGMAKYG